MDKKIYFTYPARAKKLNGFDIYENNHYTGANRSLETALFVIISERILRESGTELIIDLTWAYSSKSRSVSEHWLSLLQKSLGEKIKFEKINNYNFHISAAHIMDLYYFRKDKLLYQDKKSFVYQDYLRLFYENIKKFQPKFSDITLSGAIASSIRHDKLINLLKNLPLLERWKYRPLSEINIAVCIIHILLSLDKTPSIMKDNFINNMKKNIWDFKMLYEANEIINKFLENKN